MKRFFFITCIMLVVFSAVSVFHVQAQSSTEFPKSNFYARTTPGVLFCDERGGLTIEVTIVGRADVKRVFISDPSGGISVRDDNAPAVTYGEMFDNGENGDRQAGDRVFTRSGMTASCSVNNWGYGTVNYYARFEFEDGRFANSWFPINVGVVANKYRGVFEVKDFGDGLSATAYAFFIEDPKSEVLDGYPLSELTCGVTNFNAYRKLYSVFADDFDIAMVTPGLQLWRRMDFRENIPYLVRVSNDVKNIGLPIFNNAQTFGSDGRLRGAIYNSFGGLDVMDHELGHIWGMDIGKSLGLVDNSNLYHGISVMGHWYENADIGGQMGLFYDDKTFGAGSFQYNGNETWSYVDNITVNTNQPYSPLELYVMGLIPPEEVPPVHILTEPNIYDKKTVRAQSYTAITIEDIMRAEGGPRQPSHEDSPKEFTLAYIVVQDIPFNEAGYAYASLMSYHLTTKNPPESGRNSPLRFYMPFYWATGGRATLDTRLPVDLPDPVGMPDQPTPTPTSASATEVPPTAAPTLTAAPSATLDAPVEPVAPPDETPGGCSLLPAGLVFLPGAWAISRRWKKQRLAA